MIDITGIELQQLFKIQKYCVEHDYRIVNVEEIEGKDFEYDVLIHNELEGLYYNIVFQTSAFLEIKSFKSAACNVVFQKEGN